MIQLRFRYMTDWGTTGAGFYVDDISVAADGTTVFSDDVEALDPAWTATGWARRPGLLLQDALLPDRRQSAESQVPLGTWPRHARPPDEVAGRCSLPARADAPRGFRTAVSRGLRP
jgi:hypothetical protein